MNISERNIKAKLHGLLGESYAKEKIQNLTFINSLIDAYIGDIMVEIKTCSEWQSNGKYRCHGRFVIEESQHYELLRNNGIYIFIVLMDNGSKKIKLVKASELETNIGYKRKITWTKIFYNL